jgi:DNA-binding protein YbaB
MSQKHGLQKIDLSGLPDPLRLKIQAQLNQMTPEKQKEFLEKASPMLARAINAAQENVKQVQADSGSFRAELEKIRLTPHGHFNQTIRPGDRNSFPVLRILGFGLVAYIIYYVLSSS